MLHIHYRKSLTVKSDDIVGRTKTYEAIIKGKDIPEAGIPESFRVLKHELQALAIDVKMLDENGEEVDINKDDSTETTALPPILDTTAVAEEELSDVVVEEPTEIVEDEESEDFDSFDEEAIALDDMNEEEA